jgi:Protein of unknown function (DUF3309)
LQHVLRRRSENCRHYLQLRPSGLHADLSMSRTLLTVLLVLLILAMIPTWPYSTGWGLGYYPSGGLTLLLIVLLVFLFARPRVL